MAMKAVLSAIAFLVMSSASAQVRHERKLFVGKNVSEALLTYQGVVEIDSQLASLPDWREEQIRKQVRFLFGWGNGGSSQQLCPLGDEKITILAMTPKSARTLAVSYAYAGTVVTRDSVGTSFDVALPMNPDTIYQQSLRGNVNVCADADYQEPGDFWFAWAPFDRTCGLRRADIRGQDLRNIDVRTLQGEIMVTSGTLVRRPNTKITYPEYERLADASGTIRISFLMGMDDPSKVRDPNTSRDESATNFRQIRKTLLSTGWTSRLWTSADSQKIIRQPVGRAEFPYVEELRKDVVQAGTGKTFHLVMLMFFAPSGMDEGSTAFHWFLKDGLENSAVVFYDGHSGIGAHMNLPEIERLHAFRFLPPQNRYQIYFWNSCSSYNHYNLMFFGRKRNPADPRGTKNLDIITTGLDTYFSVSHDTNMALIGAIDMWAQGRARFSYQQLIKRIDSKNLAGINGDEDNPTR